MLSLNIPTLKTDRLVLRAPDKQDFALLVTFFADKDRSWGFGGPSDRTETWRWFASAIGHWALLGYGFWMVETHDGQTVGMVGIWNPEGWPEPELGWVMFAEGEGKGYACEAAVEVRRYAYHVLNFKTLTSNILPGNTRSVALAERLGAVFEREFENPTWGRELMYRHPAPEVTA